MNIFIIYVVPRGRSEKCPITSNHPCTAIRINKLFFCGTTCFRVCLVGLTEIRKGSKKGVCVCTRIAILMPLKRTSSSRGHQSRELKMKGKKKVARCLETAGCTHSAESIFETRCARNCRCRETATSETIEAPNHADAEQSPGLGR